MRVGCSGDPELLVASPAIVDEALNEMVQALARTVSRSIVSIELIPHAVWCATWPPVNAEHQQRPFVLHEQHLGLCTCLVRLLPLLRAKAFERAEEAVPFNLLFLLCEPAIQTLWNRRRSWLRLKILDVNEEWHLSKLILTRKPKCQDVFAYREWMITEFMGSPQRQSCTASSFLADEFLLCDTCAAKYRCNYAAWNYRRFLMKWFSQVGQLGPTNLLSA